VITHPRDILRRSPGHRQPAGLDPPDLADRSRTGTAGSRSPRPMQAGLARVARAAGMETTDERVVA